MATRGNWRWAVRLSYGLFWEQERGRSGSSNDHAHKTYETLNFIPYTARPQKVQEGGARDIVRFGGSAKYLILVPDKNELLAAPDDGHEGGRLRGLRRLVDHNC